MPQGLSAGRPTAYRPGPAGRQHKGDRPSASDPQARLQKTPGPVRPCQPAGPAPLEPPQHGEQLVAAEPGPPRSQRHHERAGRLQQNRSTTPRNWPFWRTAGLPLRHAVFDRGFASWRKEITLCDWPGARVARTVPPYRDLYGERGVTSASRAAQIWAIFCPGGDAVGGRLPRRGLPLHPAAPARFWRLPPGQLAAAGLHGAGVVRS